LELTKNAAKSIVSAESRPDLSFSETGASAIHSRRSTMVARAKAKVRVERLRQCAAVLAAVCAIGGVSALAQQQQKGQGAQPKSTQVPNVGEVKATVKAVPVNPTDAVAVVNGEKITRAQLADECVARKGTEILDSLIARLLIEQAMRANKLQVTAPEIEGEIEKVAHDMAGITKEAWLRELEKNRSISPYQYRRDVIYPSIALRKLATVQQVVVTDADLQTAYEAKYGDKLVCRMIMVPTLDDARQIWNIVKRNPAGFQKEAELRSRDEASRAIGGMLGRPLSRHEQPPQFSNAAFTQLVDGDKLDNDPAHKPKDGDISGVIQVNEMSWVILKREGLIPDQKRDWKNDPDLRKELQDLMFEAKVRERMTNLLEQLTDRSSIENRLTGLIHTPEVDPDKNNVGTIPSTASMSNDPKLKLRTAPLPASAGRDTNVGRTTVGTPVGVSDKDKPFANKKDGQTGGTNP
jgi:foldase protein PrsA